MPVSLLCLKSTDVDFDYFLLTTHLRLYTMITRNSRIIFYFQTIMARNMKFFLFYIFLCIPVIWFLLNIQRPKIKISTERRVQALGLNFAMDYKVTGSVRKRWLLLKMMKDVVYKIGFQDLNNIKDLSW